MTIKQAVEGFAIDNALLCGSEPGTIERNEMAIDALNEKLDRSSGCDWCHSCYSCDEYGSCPHQLEFTPATCDHYEPKDLFCKRCGRPLTEDT